MAGRSVNGKYGKRTKLFCALALLGGAGVAHGQGWPMPATNGYPTQAAYNGNYGPQGYAISGMNGLTGQPDYSVNGFPNYAGSQPLPSTPQVPMASAPPVAAQAPATPPQGGQEVVSTPVMTGPVDPNQIGADGPPAPKDPNGDSGSLDWRDRLYASAGYTLLYLKPSHLTTPLITTGSISDVHPGALGQPGTVVLFGDQLHFDHYSGGQGEIGLYLDPERTLSLDWSGFFVNPRHEHFLAASDMTGNPLITRPVINAVTGEEAAYLDAFPGVAGGGASVDARSELFGTEVDAIYHTSDGHVHFDMLLGFRYLQLDESLSVTDQLQPLTSGFLTFEGTFLSPTDTLIDVDSFRTTNRFYGGQVGAQLGWDWKRLFINTFGKVGLGATDEHVDIAGSTTLITPTGAQVASGGILALPSNIGGHSRTVLGFVPEGGIQIGLRLTQHVEVQVGYSFLWWNDVVRPGRQINRNVNPAQVPTDVAFGQPGGPAQPSFSFNSESLWIHNINCGLAFHF